MTRERVTLDQLETRRRWAVRNLCSGRGYAMKALVAYDMLVEDVPALLAVARATEQVIDQFDFPSNEGDLYCPWCCVELTGLARSPHAPDCEWLALRNALDALYAPKDLIDMEEATR